MFYKISPVLLGLCGLLSLAHAQKPAAEKQQEEAGPATAPAYEKVAVDSLANSGVFSSKPAVITAYLLKAPASESGGKAPGAVLAPACEGLMAPDGKRIKVKYRRMGKLLNDMGMTVLMVDGFTPRGFDEVCTRAHIDPITRLKDSLGGLAYLRGLDSVAANKIVLVTWGATAGLQGMNKANALSAKPGAGFAGAVMFYPDCTQVENRFAPYAPVQMFVGEKDAWNPAAPCQALSQRQEAGSAPFSITIYPDAYHGFDAPLPPHINNDNRKLGPVMVGNNPAAMTDAYKVTAGFVSGLFNKP